MKIWLDAQLSPGLAGWISHHFDLDASHIRDHGLLGSEDSEIFEAARSAGVVFITKDRDFVDLVSRHGPPPQVVWLTCGNTSNARMKQVLQSQLSPALDVLGAKEPLVEIRDAIAGGGRSKR